MSITKEQLLQAIETMATETNTPKLQTISVMQTASVHMNDGEATLEMLIEIKQEIIDAMDIL